MGQDTKRLLLEVAGAVFAEQGFRAASIRDICQRAHANVAAVHYHFGDKEALYREVVGFAYQQALREPVELLAQSSLSPEEKLRKFVEALLPMGSQSGGSWHRNLVIRELLSPTPVVSPGFSGCLEPLLEALRTVIAELLGPDASSDQVEHCSRSVIGQCLYFSARDQVRTEPTQEPTGNLIDHICQFSLGGIRQAIASLESVPGTTATAGSPNWNAGSD